MLRVGSPHGRGESRVAVLTPAQARALAVALIQEAETVSGCVHLSENKTVLAALPDWLEPDMEASPEGVAVSKTVGW